MTDQTQLADHRHTLFWDLATPMIIAGEAEEGTMMGFKCLRHRGQFFASLHRETNGLIVKLPKERVQELIQKGTAEPFAPNGRTFKEWALILPPDEPVWRNLLIEAKAFAETKV